MIVGEDFREEMSEFQKEIEAIPNTLREGSPEFIQAYWEWWDSVSPEFRLKYENNSGNMSHVYFFNAIWRKRNESKGTAG